MPTMFIIRGVSGSGKSSLAELLSVVLNCNYWEADEYFMQDGKYVYNPLEIQPAHKWCYSQVYKDVQHGEPVIISNTSLIEAELEEYLSLAGGNGYRVVSLVVEKRHDGVNQHDLTDHRIEIQESILRNNLKLK